MPILGVKNEPSGYGKVLLRELQKNQRMCFFRPSASRLSPGRNTVFVPIERIVQHLASFPLWRIKREHGSRRSQSCLCGVWTTPSTATEESSSKGMTRSSREAHMNGTKL